MAPTFTIKLYSFILFFPYRVEVYARAKQFVYMGYSRGGKMVD